MIWDWSIDGWIVLVGVLSAVSCALLGNYLVLRKMSLMGDAISHAVLPGLAIAFIITGSRAAGPMLMGAMIVGVATALLVQLITKWGKVEQGAAMGVVFSVMFAVGLVLIRQAADKVDLDPGCVLLGNISNIALDAALSADDVKPGVWNSIVGVVGNTPVQIRHLAFVLLLNVIFILLFYKELKITSFDPELATTLGINASFMHYALMVMVAITTVANFEAVGSILVIGMLIVPAAAAHLLTDRLGVMIVLSAAIAALSGVFGHLLAIWGPGWVGLGVDTSVETSAMIAVVAGALLLAVLMLAPEYGLISRFVHRAALSLQIVREDVLGLLYRWQEMQAERPMPRSHVVRAVGGGALSRVALAMLGRRGQLMSAVGADGASVVRLTPDGLKAASQLVRSHRLWEAYLAKHFVLPDDHLHMPAERMEHHITEELRERLASQLTAPAVDPHGREIPAVDDADKTISD
jgi:manganese/zinc/iron transport system permease protein